MAHLRQQHASIPGRLTLHVTNLYCVCCAEELEARLRAEPHISRSRVGFRSKTVDVSDGRLHVLLQHPLGRHRGATGEHRRQHRLWKNSRQDRRVGGRPDQHADEHANKYAHQHAAADGTAARVVPWRGCPPLSRFFGQERPFGP